MPEFKGFQAQDFGETEGTIWRCRESLGGILAGALRAQLGLPYQSWAIYGRPELHLAHDDKYKFRGALPYAKLFVYAYSELAAGFYVETPAPNDPGHDGQKYVHWRNFRERLQTSSALQAALLSAMLAHDLVVTDYYRQDVEGALGCRFQFREGQLQRRFLADQAWKAVPVKSLFERLAQLPEDQWVDLHIFAAIPRQAAIDTGPRVVGPILSVLRALAPVYEMTVAG